MKKRFLSYLAMSAVIATTVLTLSAFNEIDQADDTGVAGKCYNVTVYDCTFGGTGATCSFTGIYGTPYSCTSIPCTSPFPVFPSTRTCVKRVGPPTTPPM